jgi:hypothetical protein
MALKFLVIDDPGDLELARERAPEERRAAIKMTNNSRQPKSRFRGYVMRVPVRTVPIRVVSCDRKRNK